jgi:hypothetical protein
LARSTALLIVPRPPFIRSAETAGRGTLPESDEVLLWRLATAITVAKYR